MARTGRPPKPVELKRKLGFPGHHPKPPRAVTAIQPLSVITRPTDEPQTGDELVLALLEAGAAAWISTTDQLATLRLVRDGWDERARLREFIADNGSSYASNGQNGTRWYPYPEVAQLADLEKRITTWLSSLGLDPASRGRLGLAEVKARSKLEEIRARRARQVSA
jgi:hypothetical protein